MNLKMDPRAADWQKQHIDAYLRTDGAEGHLADFSAMGAGAAVPCLILKTTGRKTGAPNLAPLIYGHDGDNYVVVASKGGAPAHPAWYLNLEADPNVSFQVVDKKFNGVARSTEGAERQRLLDMMTEIYPPYPDYQKRTDRLIPVVVLEPRQAIAHI